MCLRLRFVTLMLCLALIGCGTTRQPVLSEEEAAFETAVAQEEAAVATGMALEESISAPSPTLAPSAAPTRVAVTESPPKELYAVGDTARLEPFRVTVTDIRAADEADGAAALEGQQFVLVDVALENISAERQEVAMLLQLILEDGAGQAYSFNVEASLDAVMQLNGVIDAGEQVSGTVGFMLPVTTPDLRFVFRTIAPGAMEEAGRVAFAVEL